MSQAVLWEAPKLSLDDAVGQARALIRQAQAEHKPEITICLFSGGDDSAVLLHIARDLIDAVAHIDTGTGIPETRSFVEEVVPKMGGKLLIETTPPSVYESLVMERGRKSMRGFPGPGMHFKCYTRLKERRLDDLKRRYVGRRGKGKILLLTGLREDESARRKMHIGASGPIHPASHSPRMIFCNPIMDFDFRLMADYRESRDVPRNPVAGLLHMSGECLCGAYAKPNEMKEIAYWFPSVGARMRALEERVKTAGQKYCTWGHGLGGKPKKDPGPLCRSCPLFPEVE